jgi:hypothetical protein
MFQVGDHTLKMATRDQNLKRKREEMQEQNPDSMHEISWQGEWLPVELWTRVFYHMLVPAPIRIDSAAQTEAMQEHPLINGIIHEFLLFRTGLIFGDLMEVHGGFHMPNPDPGWLFMDTHTIWTPIHVGFNWESSSATRVPARRMDYMAVSSDHEYGGMYFECSGERVQLCAYDIRIRLGNLFAIHKKPISKSGSLRLTMEAREWIQCANFALPYGLHFRQILGKLVLRAPNNPRAIPEGQGKYRILRTFSIERRRDRHDDPLRYCYVVQCTISLNEIYIPSWRPYYVSRDGDRDSESQAETGGDAESISGSGSRSRNLS